MIIKRMLIFGSPSIILIATGLLFKYISLLTTPSQLELVVLSPYLVTILGMFLAIHYHRCRPFMALLLLIVFYWYSRNYLTGDSIDLKHDKLYQAFLLLIPVNIALIAFMRERGFVTKAGRLRFAFIAVQAVLAYKFFPVNYYNLLPPYIPSKYNFIQMLKNMHVPESTLVAGVICLILIAILMVRRQTPIDSGLLGALTAFFIACNWMADINLHIAFCTSGAVIISLSVLRDSYNMAFRDDLTGLPSRRALNESLQGMGRNYAIAMLDVDHFKKFNDTYGHDVGDQVLKMVASKMMDVSGGGKAYRYGGEEFTILFPGRRAADAVSHLEELRKSIAGYQLAMRGTERPQKEHPKNQKQMHGQRGNRKGSAFASVTISIGVAERNESQISTEAVMKAADKALYKAKNLGRNQVVC